MDVESEALQKNVLRVRVDSITQPVRYLGMNAWEIDNHAWIEIGVDGIEVVVHDVATGERRSRTFADEVGFLSGWKTDKSTVFSPTDGAHWLTIGALLTHIRLAHYDRD